MPKRTYNEVKSSSDNVRDDDAFGTHKASSILGRLRNMWQFANLYQWIVLFGKVVKLDDNIDIEVRLSLNLLYGCEQKYTNIT
jgi:hypothetical protein